MVAAGLTLAVLISLPAVFGLAAVAVAVAEV